MFFHVVVELMSFIRKSSDVSLGIPGKGLLFSGITCPLMFRDPGPRLYIYVLEIVDLVSRKKFATRTIIEIDRPKGA